MDQGKYNERTHAEHTGECFRFRRPRFQGFVLVFNRGGQQLHCFNISSLAGAVSSCALAMYFARMCRGGGTECTSAAVAVL